MTRQRPAHPFSGGVKKKPTQRHKPVIWEGILGAVYAASPEGVVKYFDYDWDGAREWAGITTSTPDLRIARVLHVSYYRGNGPSSGRWALWAKR